MNATLPAGSSAGLFVGLVNTGPRDRLVRVSAPGAATSVTLPAGGVLLERDTSALLTGPEPKLVLTGLTRSLAGGTYVKVLLTFQSAGTVTPGRPGARPVELVRHVLAGPDGRRHPARPRRAGHHGQASATPTPSAGGTATAAPTATPHGPDPDS